MALVAFQRNPAPAPKLDHLRALEAESIHILREVVAEFERPVMLYSIGKDSSVMVRLAQKAEERCCYCNRLIKTLDRISERPL